MEELPAYDPLCYLCPGNLRANGERNPEYATTFLFTNDYAALHPDSPTDRLDDGLLMAQGEQGRCLVVCFSPRHDLTLPQMPPTDVRRVVDLWAEESTALGAAFPWVQVFENRGAAMGASNPHPHGQIWAGSAIPSRAGREDAAQRRHYESSERRLLLDYLAQEIGGPREVEADDEWLIVVPFWAGWPFETMVIAKQPASRLPDLAGERRSSLGAALRALLIRYDNLFRAPFPYSMGWHQAPFGPDGGGAGGSIATWQLHAHLFPPLQRASVRKFMVGYELLAETQRDLTAEDAAGRLRAVVPIPAG